MSVLRLTSNYYSLFYLFLGTIPSVLDTIGNTVTFMFYNFFILFYSFIHLFCSLARFKYFSLFRFLLYSLELMVFHKRLSDSKSPQVSRTLLSILAVFNNAVVWMVSTQQPNFKSSRPFNNPLVTVPKAPITIGIIVTFIFHSFFNSLARSRHLSLFSHSFRFILWSAGTAKSTILQIIFSFVDYY